MAKASRNKAKDVESVKKTLFIKDRIVIGSILPKQSNIITMRLAQDIQKRVELTQADFKKYKIIIGKKGGLQWKAKKDTGTIYTFSSAEMELLKLQIDKLDKENKITDDILALHTLIRE